MAEFLWFISGAMLYQILVKVLRISQLYMFFQEMHVHSLLLLEAASQDLENAAKLKAEMLAESELKEKEIEFIESADKQAIETWRTTAITKIQKFVPGPFKSVIKYNNWDEMRKYLHDIIKL